MLAAMPRVEKAPTHRNSISTASAAGGGARSSSWSAKDDDTLIAARAQGLNWNQIAPKHFPTKSPNACRKRHERLMERQHAEQWDGIKLEELAQAYMEVRGQMWAILATRVGGGEKWTTLERKCMEKGLKNLNQAYRSAQRKQGNSDGHYDSGIGNSDLEEEPEDRPADMAEVPDNSAQFYPIPQQQLPSISSTPGSASMSVQSMLTGPTQRPQHPQYPSQYQHQHHHHHQHNM